MRPVFEQEPRRIDAAVRTAGDDALGVSVILVVSLLALASALAARPAPAPASAESTPLPIVATPAAWDGAETAGGRVLVSTEEENGRLATLRGGDSWRDYTVRARLRWLAGDRVSLLVRMTDTASYVACVLEDASLRIVEVSDGESRTLAVERIPRYRGRTFDAVVAVDGASVSVALDGATVASAVTAHARSGTAGIEAWDAEWGRAGVEAEYVRVEREE